MYCNIFEFVVNVTVVECVCWIRNTNLANWIGSRVKLIITNSLIIEYMDVIDLGKKITFANFSFVDLPHC